ncbi:MAG: dihydroneopterin aldolase [Deltaproteobacteria bacterium]|nr:dihydroneopterin aldolase [Deltaproteobacteria bacterium]
MFIRIKNLKLKTKIGVYPEERKKPQEIILQIKIELMDDRAGQSDDLSDTLDYDELCQKISLEVEKSEFFLLEKLASHLLDLILENEKTLRAWVEITKLHILKNADAVSVEAFRDRL